MSSRPIAWLNFDTKYIFIGNKQRSYWIVSNISWMSQSNMMSKTTQLKERWSSAILQGLSWWTDGGRTGDSLISDAFTLRLGVKECKGTRPRRSMRCGVNSKENFWPMTQCGLATKKIRWSVLLAAAHMHRWCKKAFSRNVQEVRWHRANRSSLIVRFHMKTKSACTVPRCGHHHYTVK